MKAKLIVEGKEFPIEINDPELQKLLKPKRKTGYERAEYGKIYWYQEYDGSIDDSKESNTSNDDITYEVANYYSDSTLAENNARADKLMRQMRRFAVEHRNTVVDLYQEEHALIYYDYDIGAIKITTAHDIKYFGTICFDSHTIAKQAIEAFCDELIWYFTEYKDSL